MPATTRRSLLAAAGLSLASAGCLSDSGVGTGEGENATRTSTQVSLETEKTTTGAPANREATRHASESPDPDHSVTLRSEGGESEVRVRIVREATDETVFETTATASPGERTLYNLRQADPEGVEGFRICAELVGSAAGGADSGETATGEADPGRDCVTIRTSACYADAHVTVRDDGSVQIVYAVC